MTVPPSGSDPELLLHRFCEVLDVDHTRLKREGAAPNPGIGYVQAELLRRLNARLAPQDRRRDVYARIGNAWFAAKVLGQQKGASIRIPAVHADWIRELSKRYSDAIRTGGYRVVGDLADLNPAPSAFDAEGDVVTIDKSRMPPSTRSRRSSPNEWRSDARAAPLGKHHRVLPPGGPACCVGERRQPFRHIAVSTGAGLLLLLLPEVAHPTTPPRPRPHISRPDVPLLRASGVPLDDIVGPGISSRGRPLDRHPPDTRTGPPEPNPNRVRLHRVPIVVGRRLRRRRCAVEGTLPGLDGIGRVARLLTTARLTSRGASVGSSKPIATDVDLVDSCARLVGEEVEVLLADPGPGIGDGATVVLRGRSGAQRGTLALVDGDRGRRGVVRFERSALTDGQYSVRLEAGADACPSGVSSSCRAGDRWCSCGARKRRSPSSRCRIAGLS